MSDFSQNGIISTLHDFGTKSLEQIEKELLGFSKERKMELILPCLYSELKGDALPKIVEEIRGTQEELQEIYNDRPLTPDPDLKQGDDPLTPTDQKFATLQDLAANYRLFVNRVEQQLYTIGGGGAGFIKDLDDVTFDATNNDLLIYQSATSKWVGIASTSLGSSTLTGLDDVDDSNLGDGRFLRYNACTENINLSLSAH